ncbi:hypothetical protein BC937DRAFT_89623 [Endogone sp. FLAS-F59071]|nr:hypothetical protein BC937DRAFT_89623 [Endogone sp. FLAS-F59071]|eukprot:RUS22350.1 hypothetical protein BC937DRAFT_89623 [Endogone sp. FLAS-F59071]
MNQYESLPTSDPEKNGLHVPTAVPVANYARLVETRQAQKHPRLNACKRFLFVSLLFLLTFSVTRRMIYPTYNNSPLYDYDPNRPFLNDGVRFCEDAEMVPWHGNGKFALDTESINSLVVKLQGTTQNSLVSIHSHNGEESDSVVVLVKVRLSDETLQKTIDIDTTVEDDIFSILINTPRELVDECVTVNIDISFPSSLGTFGNLEIKVPNFDIFEHCIENNLQFGSVDIGTTVGDIYVTNLITTSATVRTANGDIKGKFDVAEDFLASAGNGWINATIAPFVHEGTEAKWDLNAKSVNGFVKLALSSTFEGRFDLYTLSGSAYVSSISHPDNIHFAKQRRNEAKGYFGASDAPSVVSLTGVHGDIEVVFE